MTGEDARAAVYARLETDMAANHAGVPVRYQNRNTVNLATQTGMFVTCDMFFNDGEQISVELNPRARYRGSVYLAVLVKEGDGTKKPLDLLWALVALYKTKTFGGVNTGVPIPVPGREMAGWYSESIRVPFYFDGT